MIASIPASDVAEAGRFADPVFRVREPARFAGRFWATDFDWQDNENYPYAYTIQLMSYMMSHRR